MKWRKLGRIFEPKQQAPWIVSHASVPIAVRVGEDAIRIYISSRDAEGRSQTGYFVVDLREPANILDISASPVLGPGAPGFFDDAGAMASWIVPDGARLRLYYIGWNRSVSVPFRNAIGLAFSDDGGLSFRRHSDGPIVDRGPFDPCFTASSCVWKEGSSWKMCYLSCVNWARVEGALRHRYHLKLAESRDGISWNRDGVVAIDFASPEEYAISRPSIERSDAGYRMWYSYRGSSYRIGYADSSDGLRWTRRDAEAGIDVSASGWDAEMIEYPFVFEHRGARYMLYNGNDFGRTGVGLAVLD